MSPLENILADLKSLPPEKLELATSSSTDCADVDDQIVWDVVQRNLPVLRDNVDALLTEE